MAQRALKNAVFVWEGKDKKGQKIKGEIGGQSEALVKANLRRQGINPIRVRKKGKPLFGGGGNATPKDIAIFSRQLATMMSSGVPLMQAFDIIGRGHEKKGVRDLLLAVKSDIEGGSSLTDSLSRHPLYFDELYVNLVRAGEHAGILDSILDKIAMYKEKTESIKGKIKKALFYPTAVLVVAFVITAILMIFVVPEFAKLFTGFGADLPAMTKFVMNLSNIFVSYWWLIFGIIIGVIYGLIQAKRRSKKFNHAMDRIMLKVPIIGTILTKAAIARYSRTLSTMFAAGVPLVEAMVSVAGAVGNVVYGEAVMRMRDDVSTGTQLNVAMQKVGLFPNMVVQMAAIGEEAGSLDSMLSKVADFYEEEVDNAVDSMSSLLEPLIMVILGVLIGGLVIAMYMPIFQMGKVVGGG
jgi:type IV pilus assembly protein PilC